MALKIMKYKLIPRFIFEFVGSWPWVESIRDTIEQFSANCNLEKIQMNGKEAI